MPADLLLLEVPATSHWKGQELKHLHLEDLRLHATIGERQPASDERPRASEGNEKVNEKVKGHLKQEADAVSLTK